MRPLNEMVLEISQDYHSKTPLPDNNIVDLLKQEGFISDRPIVDVACGPSPHVGYRLAQEVGGGIDIIFNDANEFLEVHKILYSWITGMESEFQKGLPKPYWELGDAMDNQAIVGNSVIIHGTIPRICTGGKLLIPEFEPDLASAKEAMKQTLGKFFDQQPANVALYIHDLPQSVEAFESTRLIDNAFKKMGMGYKKFNNVYSANFNPRRGGSLYIVNNVG